MHLKKLQRIQKIFNNHPTYSEFESYRQENIKDSELFEALAHYALKVNSSIFKSNNRTNAVYWPNNVPSQLRDQYRLNDIIQGGTTLGGDTFIMLSRLTAVEFKGKHKNKKESIRLGKIAVKDVALNKTKIGKSDRILIHEFDSESKKLIDFLDWKPIHITDLYNESTFEDIKQSILHNNLPVNKPWSYRTDLLDGKEHKKQLDNLFQALLSHYRTLLIWPTSCGKGTVPPLIVRKYFYENIWKKEKKKKLKIIVSMNPSLTVLTGNLIKQVKDHNGSGLPIKSVVFASDLTPDENPKDVDLLELYADVIKQPQQFYDIYDSCKQDEILWINSTHQSYANPFSKSSLVQCLKVLKVKNVDVMFIDEVKWTTQSKDSIFADCLNDSILKADYRVGMDANIVQALDDKGNQSSTSMKNTSTWPYTQTLKTKKAWELGWRRRDNIIYQPWESTGLPSRLQRLINEGKNGLLKVPGYRSPVPLHWVMGLATNLNARYTHSEINYALLRVRTKEQCGKFAKFANALTPHLLKQFKPTNAKQKQILGRLKNLRWQSIYDLGNSTRQIIRGVSNIPRKYKDANVIQDKLLTEGWDPGSHPEFQGWLNTWQMIDFSFSKVSITQLAGRSARLGDDIFNTKNNINYHIHPILVGLGNDKLVQLQKASLTIKNVAEALEIGQDVIEDTVTILPWTNVNVATGKSKKGNTVPGALVPLTSKEIMNAVHRQLGKLRLSPWTSTVDEIYNNELSKFFGLKGNTNSHVVKELYDKTVSNKRYKDFFAQYKNRSCKKSVCGNILKGTHWAMSEDLQIKAQQEYREWKKECKDLYEKRVSDVYESCVDFVNKPMDTKTFAGYLMFHETSPDTIKRFNSFNSFSIDINKDKKIAKQPKAVSDILRGKGPLSKNNPQKQKEYDCKIQDLEKQHFEKFKMKLEDIQSEFRSCLKKSYSPSNRVDPKYKAIKLKILKKHGFTDHFSFRHISTPVHEEFTGIETKNQKLMLDEYKKLLSNNIDKKFTKWELVDVQVQKTVFKKYGWEFAHHHRLRDIRLDLWKRDTWYIKANKILIQRQFATYPGKYWSKREKVA